MSNVVTIPGWWRLGVESVGFRRSQGYNMTCLWIGVYELFVIGRYYIGLLEAFYVWVCTSG
jgi:hypothetical protein